MYDKYISNMSLSISKLLDLASDNNKVITTDVNPDIPVRYSKIKGVKGMVVRSDKNHNYSPYEFDEFNEVMKQSKYKRYNVSGLHLDLKHKRGTMPIFKETDGWWEPGQRRRAEGNPNHAPPFDFVNGAAYQRFDVDKDEIIAHDNISLIQAAHKNYNNWVNRYNVPSIPVTLQK